MPIHDWQFWVVTIVMCMAMFMLRKVVFPKKKGKKTKATLTVGGKPVTKSHKSESKDCGCS